MKKLFGLLKILAVFLSRSSLLAAGNAPTDQCRSNPCQNSGICSSSTSTPSYTCDCTSTAFQGPNCSERKFVANGTCQYHVHYKRQDSYTHDQANDLCLSEGGTLAMMKSAGIQDFVEEILVAQYGETNNEIIALWIGGYKMGDTWLWMDGTKIPMDGDIQRWTVKTGEVMVITSDRTNRRSLNWVGLGSTATRHALVCEKPGNDVCESFDCMNGGTCVAVGCQKYCQCLSGYDGINCQTDHILIHAKQTVFLVTIGGSVIVTLNVTSEDGPVMIEVSMDSFTNINISKSNVPAGLINVTIGPFRSPTPNDTYVFRVSPESISSGSYSRTISVTISVQDHCTSNPCQKLGRCTSNTTSPYFTCDCSRTAFEGKTCSEPKFIANGNCKYHVYYDSTEKFTHEQANNSCVTLRGTLAMMKSANIQDFVDEILIDQYGRSGAISLWIGGYKTDGIWLWMDGTRIPIEGEFQKWMVKEGEKMLMTSWQTNRSNMEWRSFSSSTERSAFVCERTDHNSCESLNCTNDGTCLAVGCQTNCKCLPGFGGINCEIDLITLFANQTIYLVTRGSLTVTLNVTSADGPVRIEVSKNSFQNVEAVKRNVKQGLVDVSIGPFNSRKSDETYKFRATPESSPGTYYRVISVTIVHEREFIAKGNCQYLVYLNKEEAFSHNVAKSFCITLGGTLAMMKSEDIQDYVEDMVINQYGGKSETLSFWIGGHKKDGIWTWMDGTKIPTTGPLQKWTKISGDGMIMTTLTNSSEVEWEGYATTDSAAGYICEKADLADPCRSLDCKNGGSCFAVGCQGICHCIPGFGGFSCKKDLIILTPVKSQFNVAPGQNVTVSLIVISEDGLVRIDAYRGSFHVETKRNVPEGVIEFSVGPFVGAIRQEFLHFRVSPESAMWLYNKSTTIAIDIQEGEDQAVKIGGIVGGSVAAIFLAIVGLLIFMRKRDDQLPSVNSLTKAEQEGPYQTTYFNEQASEVTYENQVTPGNENPMKVETLYEI